LQQAAAADCLRALKETTCHKQIDDIFSLSLIEIGERERALTLFIPVLSLAALQHNIVTSIYLSIGAT
jgi:hypothetical protein